MRCLTHLLQEFASSSRSSAVGLTWEFHIACKRDFEVKGELKQVFLITVQLLQPLAAASPEVLCLTRPEHLGGGWLG